METTFRTRALKVALEEEKACRRTYGAEMAKKIRLRLTALRAAEALVDFWPPMSGPERCHALKENLAGQFSMDLKHPYRLLFVATNAPEKTAYPNEVERWTAITSVEIVGIEDTHG
jgi:plasmid maintenance system killer protein